MGSKLMKKGLVRLTDGKQHRIAVNEDTAIDTLINIAINIKIDINRHSNRH